MVTGANGFIGSHLCEELIKLDAQVTAVVRKKSNLENLAPFLNKLTLKEADLRQPQEAEKAVGKESIIIHAAAIDGGGEFKRKFADKIFHDNILMTLNILKAAREKKVEKFLYVSSAEVYGGVKNKNKIKESDFKIFLPTKAEHWYIWSKIVGEYACQLTQAYSKLKVIIVRPANIYGPRDKSERQRLVPTLIESIKKGAKKIELKGSGRQLRSFLYVDDFIKNLLELIAATDEGIYNIAGENIINIKDFAGIFGKVFGLKIIFKDKRRGADRIGDSFILDVGKIKKTTPIWYDSPYEKRIRELI